MGNLEAEGLRLVAAKRSAALLLGGLAGQALHPQALARRHSLTAPSSEPEMIRFWKTKNINATGIVMSTAAASLSG